MQARPYPARDRDDQNPSPRSGPPRSAGNGGATASPARSAVEGRYGIPFGHGQDHEPSVISSDHRFGAARGAFAPKGSRDKAVTLGVGTTGHHRRESGAGK